MSKASEERPYTCTNSALAHALSLAGVPWFRADQPTRNIYTPDRLHRLGLLPKGERSVTRIQRAAQRAVELGYPGEVTYHFKRVPQLENLLKGWDSQMAEIKAVKAGTGVATDIPVDPFTLMRVLASAQANRGPMREACFAVEPFVKLQNQGEVKQTKTHPELEKPMAEAGAKHVFGTTTMPGFKVFRASATTEELRKLKVIK